MNATSLRTYFIIATAFVLQAACIHTPASATPNAAPPSDSPDLFQSTWYLAVYILAWNLLFEVSLVIVLHFKQKPFYVAEHSFINSMVVLTQLINNFFLLRRNGYSLQNRFILTELGITAAVVLQLTLGGLLNRKLQSERLVKGIFILRFLHKNWGRLVYLATKFQIATYSYHYLQESAVTPLVFISVLFGLTALTHVTLWFVLNTHATEDIEVSEYLVNSSPKAQEYSDLLRNIDSGEIEYNPEIVVTSEHISELPSNILSGELLESAHEIAWVIIEDKVFDITGLRHPKGNYILKSVRFRDITREVYGLKGWRFSENGLIKVSRHRHVARTFEFLKQHCIGELNPNGTIASNSHSDKQSVSETNSNLNLFDTKSSHFGVDPRKARFASWSLTQSHEVGDFATVGFLLKAEKDHVVNLSAFWLKNFGKYFFVRNQAGRDDFYFVTLSLSPRYLNLRQQWHRKLNFKFLEALEGRLGAGHHELAELSPMLLNAAGNDFAALINRGDDVRDPFLPFFHHRPDHRHALLASKNRLRVNGPIGLGMGFEPNSTKKILIAVRDAGVLPFADFFEYMGQRALIELDELRIPHPLFGKEYLLYYINEIAIWVYWEISDQFWESAQLLGLFGLEAVNAVAKEPRFAQNKNDFTKIVNVLQRVNLVCGQSPRNDNRILHSRTPAANFGEVMNSVVGADATLVNKVVVSGDMSFANRVLKNVTLPPSQVIVL